MNWFGAFLQIEPFLPPVPWQLPAVLLGIGFLCMSYGLAQTVAPRALTTWGSLYPGERGLIIVLTAVGILVGGGAAFQSRKLLWYYALLLAVAGRVIEGALITRIVAKALNWFSASSGDFLASVLTKLRDRAARVLFTGVISTMLMLTIAVAFIRKPTGDAIIWTALAYTVARVGLVSITVIYQLKDVVDRFSHLSIRSGYSLTTGLVCAIAGAEVFDMPPLLGVVTIPSAVLQSPTGLLALRFAGIVGLLAGVVVSWGMLVRYLAGQ